MKSLSARGAAEEIVFLVEVRHPSSATSRWSNEHGSCEAALLAADSFGIDVLMGAKSTSSQPPDSRSVPNRFARHIDVGGYAEQQVQRVLPG